MHNILGGKYMAKLVNKFKVGDIVQLKSNGPKMTIDKVYYPLDPITHEADTSAKATSYLCIWFNGKKVEHANFAEESLMLPEDDKKEGKQGE
jgi:uncharacterized protein YodC (DUF2158 family)